MEGNEVAGSPVKVIDQRRRFRLLFIALFGAILIFAAYISTQFIAFDDVPIIYVSAANGNDTTGTGAIDRPFKSLKRAADYLDLANLNSGVKVYVREGEYDLTSTLAFTPVHNGISGAPTTFMKYPGENVVIRGSYKVPALTPVSGTIYKASLVGTLAENARPDFVYFNDTQLLEARYPNHKEPNYALSDTYQGTRTFAAPDQVASKNVVKYRTEDAVLISKLVGNNNLKVRIDNNQGIWTWHQVAAISSINTATREITLNRTLPYNISSGDEYVIVGPDVDLLSPGEFYIDPASKELFVNLTTSLTTTDRVGVPVLDKLVTVGASNFTWHGFKMEEFNDTAFKVDRAVTDVTFQNNDVSFGKSAFSTEYYRATNLKVDGNHIHHLDGTAVGIFGGGFMKTLTNSGDVISNNYIHHIDLIYGNSFASVVVDKERVGITVSNNTITDVSRHGITIAGPNHRILNNTVIRASQLRHDAGALHIGGRIAQDQGVVFDGNVVENVGSRLQRSYGVWEFVDDRSSTNNYQSSSFGAMLDDWTSGIKFTRNIIKSRKAMCVSNHSGGRSEFNNNYFACGDTGLIFGGIKIGDPFFDPLYVEMYNKIQTMGANGYDVTLYNQTFPNLSQWPAPANLQNGDIMVGNKVTNNVFETYRPYKIHLGAPARFEFTGNILRNTSAFNTFRAGYEAPTAPGSYADLNKTQWQALGLDLDLRELTNTQPLFKVGTYEIDQSSPAYGATWQALNPGAAGSKTASAPRPTVNGPVAGEVSTPDIPINVTDNASPFSYQNQALQFQVRKVTTSVETPLQEWQLLPDTEQTITIPSAVSGDQYKVYVRALPDAVGLNTALAWGPEGSTAAITFNPGAGGNGSDTTPPTVSLISPADGSTVSGTASFSVDAKDINGVSYVKFFINNTEVGNDTTFPFSYEWNTTTYSNGSYQLFAKASDAAGNVGTSAVRQVTVSNQQPSDTTLPTVRITRPTEGQVLSGNQEFKITATDNIKVDRVELIIDGQLKTTWTPLTAAANVKTRIQTKQYPNGNRVIKAVAIDSSGNRKETVELNVVFNNQGNLFGGVIQYFLDKTGKSATESEFSKLSSYMLVTAGLLLIWFIALFSVLIYNRKKYRPAKVSSDH